MGSYLDYHCPACEYRVAIGGPDEFYLSPGGERRLYGHPSPISPEAEARGVDGFWMRLWCAGCNQDRLVVTVEFEEPVDALAAWCGRGKARPGYMTEVECCPECKSELLDEIPGPLPRCPACAKDALVASRLLT